MTTFKFLIFIKYLNNSFLYYKYKKNWLFLNLLVLYFNFIYIKYHLRFFLKLFYYYYIIF